MNDNTKIVKKLDDRKKAARKKYLSNQLAIDLVNYNPSSELVKSYWNTYHCRNTITVAGGETRAAYCKNRWCLTCQSIRVAKSIEGYTEQLEEFKDPYFVTLTAPTVPEEYLPARIKDFGEKWRAIMKLSSKRKRGLVGLRKSECTIRPNGHYHFHYHVIVEGEDNAVYLFREWLRLNPSAREVAQDVQPFDSSKGWIELFKYFTKLTTKIVADDGVAVAKTVSDPRRLDVVFRAMRGIRVYQPFGGLRVVNDEVRDQESEKIQGVADGVYSWYASDWYNIESGEAFAEYTPQIGDNFKFHKP